MRKGRFSDAQIVAILREADANPVRTVANKLGASERVIYMCHDQHREAEVRLDRVQERPPRHDALSPAIDQRAASWADNLSIGDGGVLAVVLRRGHSLPVASEHAKHHQRVGVSKRWVIECLRQTANDLKAERLP